MSHLSKENYYHITITKNCYLTFSGSKKKLYAKAGSKFEGQYELHTKGHTHVCFFIYVPGNINNYVYFPREKIKVRKGQWLKVIEYEPRKDKSNVKKRKDD